MVCMYTWKRVFESSFIYWSMNNIDQLSRAELSSANSSQAKPAQTKSVAVFEIDLDESTHWKHFDNEAISSQ